MALAGQNAAGGVLSLLDLTTGKILERLHSPTPPTSRPRFHPDGVLLCVGCEKGILRLFDLRSASEAATFATASPAPVSALAASENGFTLASAAGGGGGEAAHLSLWDLRKTGDGGQLVASAAAAGNPAAPINALAFDASGGFLGAGHGDGIVSVWDSATGGGGSISNLLTLPQHHTGGVIGLAWGPDAGSLFSLGATDRLLHGFTSTSLKTYTLPRGTK